MLAGYELFDHTADIGVRAFAPTLAELVRVAGEGLYGVIGELVADDDDVRAERFEFRGDDLGEMLRDYLAELLLIFERDHRVMTAVRVEAFEPGRLAVTGETRPVNRDRSAFDREVKAVTYHGLDVRPIEDGYEVRYVADV